MIGFLTADSFEFGYVGWRFAPPPRRPEALRVFAPDLQIERQRGVGFGLSATGGVSSGVRRVALVTIAGMAGPALRLRG